MTDKILLIDRLAGGDTLSHAEFLTLLTERDEETVAYLTKKADEARRRVYQNRVFVRGLIEISNVCKNDCFYCGVRASNSAVCRYRLREEEILSAVRRGHEMGFRTFVLQGGEDAYFTDERLTRLIRSIKTDFPDCAVTLSLGERSRESYAALKAAGADRYLLRHETANGEHYARLHPASLTLKNRLRCLFDLKELGFQVGAGFMVGTPHQTLSHLAEDLVFIQSFRPQMCGVGPFLPASGTPFEHFPAGDTELCLVLLSLLRLIDPALLLPSTTALASARDDGRERGILAGANVVMPNLSPAVAKENYTLYDGKQTTGAEDADALAELSERMARIGFTLDYSRGDYADGKGA